MSSMAASWLLMSPPADIPAPFRPPLVVGRGRARHRCGAELAARPGAIGATGRAPAVRRGGQGHDGVTGGGMKREMGDEIYAR